MLCGTFKNILSYQATLGSLVYRFSDLKTLLAKATPKRSGDELAGVAAQSAEERVAAQIALADVPLKQFLHEPLTPYKTDEVTRLIFDTHDERAFAEISHLTVGAFRDWLLDGCTDGATLARIAPGVMPEQSAAVSKLMRQQDLVKVSSKINVVTRFRTTVGLPGRLATGSSQTIPRTMRAALRPASSMDSCWAAVTRLSALIPLPTIRKPSNSCSP